MIKNTAFLEVIKNEEEKNVSPEEEGGADEKTRGIVVQDVFGKKGSIVWANLTAKV